MDECIVYVGAPDGPIFRAYRDIANNYNRKPINERDSGFDLFFGTISKVLHKRGRDGKDLIKTFISDTGIKIVVKNKKGDYMPFDLLPRSSTPIKFDLMLANSVGLIDRSYRDTIRGIWRIPYIADQSDLDAVLLEISQASQSTSKNKDFIFTRVLQVALGTRLPFHHAEVKTLSDLENMLHKDLASNRGGGLGSTGHFDSEPRVGVIGYYGDDLADSAPGFFERLHGLCNDTVRNAFGLNPSKVTLVGNGGSWCNHIPVYVWIKDSGQEQWSRLVLFSPTAWSASRSRYSTSVREGSALNGSHYHCFKASEVRTLKQIGDVIGKPGVMHEIRTGKRFTDVEKEMLEYCTHVIVVRYKGQDKIHNMDIIDNFTAQGNSAFIEL